MLDARIERLSVSAGRQSRRDLTEDDVYSLMSAGLPVEIVEN